MKVDNKVVVDGTGQNGRARSRSQSPIDKMPKNADVIRPRISARRNAVESFPMTKSVNDLRGEMQRKRNKENTAQMESDLSKTPKMATETFTRSADIVDWNNVPEGANSDQTCDNSAIKASDYVNMNNMNNSIDEREILNAKKANLHGAGYVKPRQIYAQYLDSDAGPYFVHLTVNDVNKESDDICDMEVGMKLKKMKVKNVREVKKVSRRELKVVFSDKPAANAFLQGHAPKELGVKAFIPNYNVEKIGIIFDISPRYSDEQLLEELEAELPIIDIYRCMKRKTVDGRKTKDFIPSNTIKVTFRGQCLPDEVTFGYSKRKVKPHIPNVMQCYKCLRFGHVNKHCKQQDPTCKNCGTVHPFDLNDPCSKATKCFHCHNSEHDGTHKGCPEYLRNQLIKESMVFKNMTFFEANEEFPRTQSSFRSAERQREFPKLSNGNRRNQDREERIEKSFPKKSAQDLSKQYNDYVQLNQGNKPTASSTTPNSKSYSEIAKTRIQKSTASRPERQNNSRTQQANDYSSQAEYDVPENPINCNPMDLIHALNQKLQGSYLDPDQSSNGHISNDLMLIDIGRMIMDFMQMSNRKLVAYTEHGISNPTLND